MVDLRRWNEGLKKVFSAEGFEFRRMKVELRNKSEEYGARGRSRGEWTERTRN